LSQYRGNEYLRPEYQHQAGIHFLRFDEFNSSSLFINLTGRYISDKINWVRNIAPDLTQRTSLTNVPDDYFADGGIEYATPVRKLGITLTASFDERYQRGMNIIDGINNTTTTFTHEFELKAGNRKKEKWDVTAGGIISYTDAKYSVQDELNNYFYNVGYFAEISYRPAEKWFFSMNADINYYYSKSFNGNVNIPLLKAEASYFFLKSNRASLTLKAFDLLNSNTGLQRISELNYLMERRSNIIGQYFMLSFKYRLNKSGEKSSGTVITIGK